VRPKNNTARDLLPHLLQRHPGAKAANLAMGAQVSLPTMQRMLSDAASRVVRVGKAGRTCYYLRRPLRGITADLPVYAIDTAGQAHQAGLLTLLEPDSTLLDVAALGWPVDQEFALGVWHGGLPYPLQDMRPQGFLGRLFAQREASTLGVSDNPKNWSDNDILSVLTQKGLDTSGNLIVGDTALQLWLQDKTSQAKIFTPEALAQGYASLADNVTRQGGAGSSAAGEFPKFTALRELSGALTPHVIVKFSAPDSASTVQRWADLLVCEHLALQAAGTMPGINSAPSRILRHQGRTFLEVERFDRHGRFGRSPLCSLETLEAALLTQTSTDWGHAGELLLSHGWLTPGGVEQLRALWAFGKLIGNTDMHKGNLSFRPGPLLQVAPVYDMLPMLYAPMAGGEVPASRFAPGLPAPQDRPAWLLASQAALVFWQSAANDQRISAPFREICRQNHDALAALMALA
jgi:hypothetical protein